MLQENRLPRVSIIIPCYNHGAYILDAIKSVETIEDKDLYELIIVNDGSTDEQTNQLLSKLSNDGYHIIFQKNSGLATSRNNAISIARGEYILPLDSDNKIRKEYVYKGINLLDANRDISIVYGNAQKFGDQQDEMVPGPYNLQKLMIFNYIDACAIFRKELWTFAGGYDKNMPYAGVEDWALWLWASFNGYKFHYVNEILYDYRVLGSSMIRQLNSNKIKGDANLEYLIAKHKDYFGPQHIDNDIMQKLNDSPVGFIGKLILKKYFPTRFNKLVAKGTLRKYI